MNKRLVSFLADPVDQSPLQYDAALQQLRSQNHARSYEIVDNVPILLPPKAEAQIRQSEQHKKLNTTFQYVEHYQQDAAIFDYFQEFQDGATLHENRRLHETILSELPKNVQTVLDVGSGKAWVAEQLCAKNVEVCSFDISIENTTRALKNHPHPNHFAVLGDVYALPFKNDSFDAVISAEVIEHVPEPAAFIRHLLRVVKPGGVVIITTPYKEVIPYYLCVHCNQPTPRHAHLHSFDEAKILALAPDTISKQAYAFSNKVLAKLRTHVVLKYFPHPAWSLIDRFTNRLLGKQERLLLKLRK